MKKIQHLKPNTISFTIQERVLELKTGSQKLYKLKEEMELGEKKKKNRASTVCEIIISGLIHIQLDSQKKRLPETNNRIEEIFEEITAKTFQTLF